MDRFEAFIFSYAGAVLAAFLIVLSFAFFSWLARYFQRKNAKLCPNCGQKGYTILAVEGDILNDEPVPVPKGEMHKMCPFCKYVYEKTKLNPPGTASRTYRA